MYRYYVCDPINCNFLVFIRMWLFQPSINYSYLYQISIKERQKYVCEILRKILINIPLRRVTMFREGTSRSLTKFKQISEVCTFLNRMICEEKLLN